MQMLMLALTCAMQSTASRRVGCSDKWDIRGLARCTTRKTAGDSSRFRPQALGVRGKWGIGGLSLRLRLPWQLLMLSV